jgi:putative ABC transport system substrate-binding protein
MSWRVAVTTGLVLGLLAASAGAGAQPAGKVYRVGYLTQGSLVGPAADRRILDAFTAGLRELGYVDGRNLKMEWREALGNNSWLPALAEELIRLKPDAIVTIATPPTEVVKQATSTIPVVGIALGDPVGSRLVPSLARPGGNVTGLAGMTPELAGKWLEVLKDALPTLSRVVVLTYPDNPVHARYGREAGVAARRLGLDLEVVHAGATSLEGIAPPGWGGRTALLVLPEGRIFRQRVLLAELARQRHVPTIGMFREFADEGFLIAYGPNLVDLWRRAAGYVDRVLRGASPSDLPIEQPVKFDFVVNLRTAKTLGLTIPPAVLARASEVID